ncbi:E3 ubiquitin-protein ligase rnf146-like [Scaptodrosophila lebanonensis]|uniref:E3 ubiquitin-protein ligase n=1 Tax=Drosophila lebanonensis TaxID=7225 RepID=A0A6J2TKQ4_DROLE|nr:E3 ubiquitin-protein ligase rnf146-like [Scaptodrosophila lebanonensis]
MSQQRETSNGTDSTASSTAGAQESATSSWNSDDFECPVCLQSSLYATRLPCGHVFCFLCIKGVAVHDRRCPMCRSAIPPHFLDHPKMIDGHQYNCARRGTMDGYQWYYEGLNGWWQYDDRTSRAIEASFQRDDKVCVLHISGQEYAIDLEQMMQARLSDPMRRRRIKRDLVTIPNKGVAGLSIQDHPSSANNTNA